MSDESTTVKNPRNAAYNAALMALKVAHADEFATLYEDQCAKHGVAYTVRLTKEERAEKVEAERLAKARAKIAALKAEFGSDVLVADVAPATF